MEGQSDPLKIHASDSLAVGVSPSSASESATEDLRADRIVPASPTNSRVKPNHGYFLIDPIDRRPILTKDPLSEATRRERKALLGLSLLAIVIMKANLIPSELSAFGLTIDNVRREWLIISVAALVGYFLIAFMAYAFSDFLGWRMSFWETVRERAIERAKLEREIAEGADEDEPSEVLDECDRHQRALTEGAIPTSLIRALIDFILPIMVGVVALTVLILFA